MAKVLQANGSKGHHRFTLTVNEDRTSGNSSFMSYSFTISPIQVGWNWDQWGDRITYNVNIGGNTYTGSIPKCDANTTETISTRSNIEIPHNVDGTKSITISFSVTDTTGVNYTCGNASASDTMVLTPLHKAPEISDCTITSELNSQLTTLGLTTTTIVQFLSKKTFEITYVTYDSATITNYSIYHNNVLIGTSATNTVTIDFKDVSELQTTTYGGNDYVGLTVAITDNKNGYTTRQFNFLVIKYTRPSMEITSSNIKRKTTGGTTLTQNIATLTFVGTCYKGNDIIGNNNTPQVQYKIWNDTEPSYSNVTTPNQANITINNFDISSINYLKVYDYKIKINDSFISEDSSPYVKADKVPTGVSVWSEYKDHVDFIKLTVDKYNPFEYSTNETKVGILNDNGTEKTIYRKVIYIASLPNQAIGSYSANISNIDFVMNVYGTTTSGLPLNMVRPEDASYGIGLWYDLVEDKIKISTTNDRSSLDAYVTIEYTKSV